MHFNQYQDKAIDTAVYDRTALRVVYPAMGLAAEVGETLNTVKKIYRDHGGVVPDDKRDALEAELGDVLWYLAVLAEDLDISLDDVAKKNLKKLRGRAQRGTLKGSGDNR
jgi:NTP pyrophosphatase (non-canonical NTP hydrolase)